MKRTLRGVYGASQSGTTRRRSALRVPAYPDLLSRVLRARFLYFYFTLSVAPRRGPRP